MSDLASSGMPVLVGPDGTRALERVSLTAVGLGAFDEAWLQRLIHDSPACLPIGEIEPGLNPFTAICRELPTPRGPLDNLLMTGTGDVCLVETKLFRNPEARRRVVAQILDYATSLFGMSYEAFERAVLGGQFAPGSTPSSLYAALPDAGKLEEAAFIDAVTSNLRRGSALLLIVGDGIRTDAEALVDGLHVHAGFTFRLALVEFSVFQMTDAKHYLVRPRVLAKTEIIQRTVVEIVGGVATVREKKVASPSASLTAENYWQALESNLPGARDALEQLIEKAEPLGVYPEFLGTLNLKWLRPGRKPVNLGYIHRNGALWTDAAAWFAPHDLAKLYVQELATLYDGQVYEGPNGATWMLQKNGRAMLIKLILAQLDAWIGPMQHFISAIQARDAEVDGLTNG